MHAQESSIASVSSMIEFLNANGPASFRETATGLVKLILVMPATNALSERSFTSYSAVRRIHNYLGSTMTQKRLMSVYKDDARKLNLIDVANDFYTGNSHRLSNLDAFQKSTYVEHLANELVLMETTINIYNYGGHTGLYKFHSFHSHSNNMVLLSRHSADTSPFFSIVWYSPSIISVL